MYVRRSRRVKTDRRDAAALADACRHGHYRPAHRRSARQRIVQSMLNVRRESTDSLDDELAAAEDQLARLVAEDPLAKRLMTRRAIGPITASAVTCLSEGLWKYVRANTIYQAFSQFPHDMRRRTVQTVTQLVMFAVTRRLLGRGAVAEGTIATHVGLVAENREQRTGGLECEFRVTNRGLEGTGGIPVHMHCWWLRWPL